MGGRKTELSETDCRLQRKTIRFSKYHYQIFNKVGPIRQCVQTVLLPSAPHSCCTRCNLFFFLFFAIQSGYKAMRKPLLIAWIPEQIISPAYIGGWAALGRWGCCRLRDLYMCCCLNDYTMIATHCALLCCVYTAV